MSDRHNGMREVFAANYGEVNVEAMLDEIHQRQDEQEAAEAEMGTD